MKERPSRWVVAFGHRAQAGAALAFVVPSLTWGAFRARRPVLERRRIRIAGLPKAFDGLRIVQLSDVHIGPTLGKRFLEDVVHRVNALRPDVVAITGDLVDGSVEALADATSPLADLAAPEGVYFVTGNHELYHGASAWEAELGRLGLTVLHNAHRVLDRGGAKLVLGGVTDYNGAGLSPHHASDPARAFRGAPDGAPRILLAHQPRSAYAAAPHGVALQLSGHTHAGQIFPFMFLVPLQQPVTRGWGRVAGVDVYAHRGTGYWGPPFRVGAPPEIAEITLVAG